MNDEDVRKIRGVVKEEINIALDPIKETLKDHGKRLERVEDKVDALSGDVEELHLDVKGIRDKEGMAHSRNKSTHPHYVILGLNNI